MTIRVKPALMEGYDEAGDHVFTVECIDKHSAEITLKQAVHTLESWQEMAAAITDALEKLELK